MIEGTNKSKNKRAVGTHKYFVILLDNEIQGVANSLEKAINFVFTAFTSKTKTPVQKIQEDDYHYSFFDYKGALHIVVIKEAFRIVR